MMKEREKKEAEEVLKKGINVILGALAMHCSKPDACNDCPYINDSDGLCQVLEHIINSEELTSLDRVPYGDDENECDERGDNDWRERCYD